MRLKRAGDYAVRCVAYLASRQLRGESGPVPRDEIATEMEMPTQFLAKIVPSLARAGIIEITRGARGGLELAQPAAQVTLLQVLEAAIGEISLNDCVLRPRSCRMSATCPVHRVWVRANQELRDTLHQADFASLTNEDLCVQPLTHALEQDDKERS